MRAFIKAVLVAIAVFAAQTATADAKKPAKHNQHHSARSQYIRTTPEECGAHLLTEAHADDAKGMEAVLNAFVERANSGKYGPKGDLCAAVYAKNQAYAVWEPKNKLWVTDKDRWERNKTFVASRLDRLEQTGTVLTADTMQFKGCTSFDNVPRPWGRFCGQAGNYFYDPTGGKTQVAKNTVKKRKTTEEARNAAKVKDMLVADNARKAKQSDKVTTIASN